ncbi:MAG: tetratricopeptide repeat protein [Thermoanaerobaculia bacterium]
MTPTSSTSSTGAAYLKTLVLTDLVDSTRLVEKLGDLRAAELSARHDRAARALLERFGGREIDKTDGFLLLFERPIFAVGFALAYHESLAKLAAELGESLTARVGIHVGEVILRENPPEEVAQGAKPLEVEGLAKPLAARLMSLARGGQTLLSRGAFDLARRAATSEAGFAESLKWLAHGSYVFKGFDDPLEVYEVGVEGWAPLAPPTTSEKARRVGGDETVLGWRPAPGLAVPHRANWIFEKKLGEGGFGEVWLAQHKKTHERRVFKFCFELERVRALQREVTVCRLLRETLGNRPDIARILDWNFDEAPYFLEFEYTEGGNLVEWVTAEGGFEHVPRAVRFEVVAQVADAVAAAHSVGVLHKDIKPANILVHAGPGGAPRARVTDFGIGAITDTSRLADLGITVLGATEIAPAAGGSQGSGTRIYMAPEVLEGKPVTTQADIYSLGVLTFQMAVGDFARALAPGWERDVDDEILREDLAAFLDGRQERRVASAAEVAQRLRTLDERRARRVTERRAAEQAELDRRALEKSSRRRKVGIAAGVVLALFGIGMTLQARRVAREAERANREAAAARQVTDFMVQLFEVSDPSEARGNAITAREVLDRGAERIEKELGGQPVVQAKLMDAIGTVYVQLGLLAPGSRLLAKAYDLRSKTLGADDPDTVDSVEDLAWVAEKKGDVQAALGYDQRALAFHRRRGAPGEEKVAKLLDDIGWNYVEQAKFDDAVASIQEGLAIRERRFGPESEEVGGSLETLAYVHFQRGEYRQAVDLLRRVLAIDEKAHGKDSLQVASAANNLAVQLRETGDYDGARQLYERSLAIQSKALGPDHADLATLYNNLGTVWQDKGDLAHGEEYFRKALELRRRVLGDRHPLTGLSFNNLGSCLWYEDKRDEAADLWRRSYAARSATLGAEHPQTAYTIANLALLDAAAGDFPAARQKLEHALAIFAKAFGKDQPGTVGTLVVYEQLLRAMGDARAADPIAARIAAVRAEAGKRGEKLPAPPLLRLPAKR